MLYLNYDDNKLTILLYSCGVGRRRRRDRRSTKINDPAAGEQSIRIPTYDLADVVANRGHLACGGTTDDLNKESSLIRGDWQSPRLTIL